MPSKLLKIALEFMNPKIQVRKYVFVFFAAVLSCTTSMALTLKITGLRSGRGHLAISVFNRSGAAGFPGDSKQALRSLYIPLEGRKELVVEIDSLSDGPWALALMHDEDSNGKLRSVLGIPREGFGFSNNPVVYVGPPSLEKCLLTPSTEKAEVEIKYFL